METPAGKIRQAQREAWDKSSTGWKKWDAVTMQFLKPTADEMIHMLQIRSGFRMLDIATGTGEPGLSMASLIPDGKVTGTDLSAEMLAVAMENARSRGITNFETLSCEESGLPLEDDSMDAISCRFGCMFFPEIRIGLEEMFRVLKPGRRLALSVWNGPEKNPWVTNSMETMIALLGLNPPAPGAPGMFRCARQGEMAEILSDLGFQHIEQKEVRGELRFDTPEAYWNFISEVASPVAFSKADTMLQNEIRELVIRKALKKCPDGNIALGSSAWVISGEKPR